jgi:hypothetical protein
MWTNRGCCPRPATMHDEIFDAWVASCFASGGSDVIATSSRRRCRAMLLTLASWNPSDWSSLERLIRQGAKFRAARRRIWRAARQAPSKASGQGKKSRRQQHPTNQAIDDQEIGRQQQDAEGFGKQEKQRMPLGLSFQGLKAPVWMRAGCLIIDPLRGHP